MAVVANAVTLVQYTYTPGLVKNSSSDMKVLVPINECAGYTTIQEAVDQVVVAPNNLFFT